MHEWQPSIPGIDLDIAGDQRMKRAVIASMAALDAEGALRPVDAAEIQSLLIMAEQVDRNATLSRATVAAVNERSGTHEKMEAFRASHAPQAGASAAWDAILAELQVDDPRPVR